MKRCEELGAISDEPGCLTRTFHSAAMQRANALVGSWMRAAGLEVREDAAFNLIGRWACGNPGARTLMFGSHLDTVRDAGKYDGPLGVLAALAVVEKLRAENAVLPFHVEIIGFSDEEGVRYQTTYLGSRAMAGTLTKRDLGIVEEKGIERARRDRRELLGYAEVHIEQGPVLEAEKIAVAVVTGIAGQSRLRVEFIGNAGHAGTVPMKLRRDALCAAAEFVLAVERCGITATVGKIEAQPGASNVIPGHVALSLDVRHLSDARRISVVKALRARAAAIAKKARRAACVDAGAGNRKRRVRPRPHRDFQNWSRESPAARPRAPERSGARRRRDVRAVSRRDALCPLQRRRQPSSRGVGADGGCGRRARGAARFHPRSRLRMNAVISAEVERGGKPMGGRGSRRALFLPCPRGGKFGLGRSLALPSLPSIPLHHA